MRWLRDSKFIQTQRVAVFGNSFGGIQTVLGAQNGNYCAAVNASGGAMSWESAPQLRTLMIEAVRKSKAPIFFDPAENDFNLDPTRVLSQEMKKAGQPFEVKFYPAFGKSEEEGHSFAYLGSSVWRDDVFAFLSKHCRK